jgi:hypothetical protein
VSVVVAYVLGVVTLPALVALAVTLEFARSGAWTVPTAVCDHSGPPVLPWAWRWHCDAEVGDDDHPCGALWVRAYVARVVPRRMLWPREPRPQEST